MTDDLDVFGAAPGSVQQPSSSVAPVPAASASPTNDLDVFGAAPSPAIQESGQPSQPVEDDTASHGIYDDLNQAAKNYLIKDTEGASNPISYAMQKTGRIGNTLATPVNYLVGKAVNNLETDWPQPVKDAAGAVGNVASGAITKAGNYISNLGMGDNYTGPSMLQLAKQDYNAIPEEGRKDIESIPGMMALAAPVEGKIGDFLAAGKDADIAPALKTKTPIADSEANFDKAKDLYGQSATKGMTFNKDQMTDLRGNLNALQPSQDTLAGKTWAKSAAADHVSDVNDVLDSGNLSFNDVLDRRSDVNSDIKAAFRQGNDKDATRLLGVKNVLTNAMLSNDAPEWQMANHEFAKGASMEPLEDLALKASTKMQPANSLDTYINNLLLDDNKTAGLKPNEIEALKGVVNNDSSDSIKKQLASGFTKYAGMALAAKLGPIGKIGGYIAGSVGASAAKDAAFAAKLKKLDMVYEAINNRPLPIKPPVASSETLALPAPSWTGAQNHPGFAGPVTGEVTPPPMTPFQARAQAAKAAAAQPAPETGNMFVGRRGTSFADNTNLPETTATIAARIGEDPRPLVQQFHGATPEQFDNMTPDQKEAVVAVAQKNRAMQTKTGPVLNVGENADQFGQTPTGSMQRPDRPNIYQPTSTETEASGAKKPYSQTATGTSQRPFQGEMPNQFEAAAQSKYGEAKAASEAELNQRWQQYKSSAEYQSSDAAKERQAQSDKYTGKDAPKTSSFSQMPDNSGRYSVDDFNFVKSNKGGPIQFADQKKAAQWILREGHANSPDQIFDIANHPSGKGYTVKQSGISDAAPAGPQRTANTRFEQPENNAKVEGVNQGKSLNPPILPADHPDAPYVPYEPKLSKPLTRSQTPYKSPILKWIADNGGVRVGSDLDKKLRPMDIAPGIEGTPVGLYKDDSVRGKIGVPRANIDTVSPESFNEQFGTSYAGDEHGYMKPEDIVDAIRNEQFGQKLGSEYQKQRMNHVADENAIQEAQTKNGLHADITKNSTLKPTNRDIENMAQKVANGEDHDKVVKDYINDTNSRMKNSIYGWKSGGPVKATKGQIGFKLKKNRK